MLAASLTLRNACTGDWHSVWLWHKGDAVRKWCNRTADDAARGGLTASTAAPAIVRAFVHVI